jgi:hypothetical protein
VGDDVIRVDDLDVVRGLDVGGRDRAFAIFAQRQGDLVTVVELEHHTLEVQQDGDDVFLDAIDRRVLMKHTSDGDFGCRVPDHRGQQHATQRVAQRMAVATLEGLQGDLGAIGRQLLNVDGFGFQQLGLHAGLPLNTPGSLHR